jgi:hypothetical protein
MIHVRYCLVVKAEQAANLPKLTPGCLRSLGKPDAIHFFLGPGSTLFKLIKNDALQMTERSSCDFNSRIEQLIESFFPDSLAIIIVKGTHSRDHSAKAGRVRVGKACCQSYERAV